MIENENLLIFFLVRTDERFGTPAFLSPTGNPRLYDLGFNGCLYYALSEAKKYWRCKIHAEIGLE
jgi:hypothetical protein